VPNALATGLVEQGVAVGHHIPKRRLTEQASSLVESVAATGKSHTEAAGSSSVLELRAARFPTLAATVAMSS
jgi:hypothetical protein